MPGAGRDGGLKRDNKRNDTVVIMKGGEEVAGGHRPAPADGAA